MTRMITLEYKEYQHDLEEAERRGRNSSSERQPSPDYLKGFNKGLADSKHNLVDILNELIAMTREVKQLRKHPLAITKDKTQLAYISYLHQIIDEDYYATFNRITTLIKNNPLIVEELKTVAIDKDAELYGHYEDEDRIDNKDFNE